MSVFVVGAKSSALARQYVQALNNTVRKGFSTGTIPQGRRTLSHASGSSMSADMDTDYKGMFKLVLEDADGNIVGNVSDTSKDYYVNVVWEEKPSNSYYRTTVGLYNAKKIDWLNKVKVVEDTYFYIDPNSCLVKACTKQEFVVNSYVFIGAFIKSSGTVFSVFEQSAITNFINFLNPVSTSTNMFKIWMTEDGVFITANVGFSRYTEYSNFLTTTKKSNYAGFIKVNTSSYTVPYYKGGVPDKTSYYFIKLGPFNLKEHFLFDFLTDDEIITLKNERTSLYKSVINTKQECDSIFSQIEEKTSSKTNIMTRIYNANENCSSKIETAKATYERTTKNIENKISKLDPSDPNYDTLYADYMKQLTEAAETYNTTVENLIKERDDTLTELNSSLQTIINELRTVQESYNKKQDELNEAILKFKENSISLTGSETLLAEEPKATILCVSDIANIPEDDNEFIYYYIGAVIKKESNEHKCFYHIAQAHLGDYPQCVRLQPITDNLEGVL